MCHSVDREPNVLMSGFNVAIHLMNIVVNKERRETKRYIGEYPHSLYEHCVYDIRFI